MRGGKGPIPLDAVRNMLLPMVKHIQALHPGKVLTIDLDNEHDALLIKMKDDKSGRSLGFAILRSQIISGGYLTGFQPNVVGLLNALGLPQEVYDQRYPAEKTLEAAVEQTRLPRSEVDPGGSSDQDPADGEDIKPGWDRVRY